MRKFLFKKKDEESDKINEPSNDNINMECGNIGMTRGEEGSDKIIDPLNDDIYANCMNGIIRETNEVGYKLADGGPKVD